MTQPTPRVGGRPWRRLCARLKRLPGYQDCWYCGQPIDLALPWPDPHSWTGDHIVPLAHGGRELDPTNVRAAHLTHNSSAGATIRRDQPAEHNIMTSTNTLPIKDESYELWTVQG